MLRVDEESCTPTAEDETSKSSETMEEHVETSINQEVDHSDQNVLLSRRSSTIQRDGTSTLGSIFLIVNAALGAGLLNFPKAFDLAGGVLTAVLVQATLLVFIMLALIILARTSNLKKSATLQEVMDTAAGPWGRRATAAIVTIYCFGECKDQSPSQSKDQLMNLEGLVRPQSCFV